MRVAHRHVQREGHVRNQGGGCVQGKERGLEQILPHGLRGNQPCDTLQPPGLGDDGFLFSSHPV